MLFFLSADNGGSVARGKERFLCSFLCPALLKYRAFVKICFHFFSHKSVEFDFGEKFIFKGNVEFTHLSNPIKLYFSTFHRAKNTAKVNPKTLF